MDELYDEELFDPNHMDQVVAVVWWLTHLLGGKVVFPLDKEFWDDVYPLDTRLVMREEDGKVVLVAERLSE